MKRPPAAPVPSPDDLRAAAEWLAAYEPAPEDPNGPAMARTAAWLRQRADQRELVAMAGQAAVETGGAAARLRRPRRRALTAARKAGA